MSTQSSTTGTSGDWVSGSVPGSPDNVVMTSSSGATVNDTAGAHSLTLNNSTPTDSSTLIPGTAPTLGDSYLILSGGVLSGQSNTGGEPLGDSIVSGSVSGDTTTLANDNNGGTLVYWTTGPDNSTTGTSSDLSHIADLSSGVVPTSTDYAFINSSEPANIVATEIAHSFTLNNFTLTDSGAVRGSVMDDTVTTASDSTGPDSSVLDLSGGWSHSAALSSGVVPTSTDDADITSSDAVIVNGAPGVNSLVRMISRSRTAVR